MGSTQGVPWYIKDVSDPSTDLICAKCRCLVVLKRAPSGWGLKGPAPRQRRGLTLEERVSTTHAYEERGISQTAFLKSINPVEIKRQTFGDWLQEKETFIANLGHK